MGEEGAEIGTVLQVLSPVIRITSLGLLVILCLIQTIIILVFLAARTHCWFMFNFMSSRTPRIPRTFCRTAFQLGSWQHVLVPGVVLPELQDFALSLSKLHDVPAIPPVQPIKIPLDGCAALWWVCFLSSVLLLRVHSNSLSRSIMKKLNRMGPSIEPWGTLLIIDLQLDLVPLTTTLWAWLFSQVLINLTVCSSRPYFKNF